MFLSSKELDALYEAEFRAQHLQFCAADAVAYGDPSEFDSALLQKSANFQQQREVLHLNMARHTNNQRDVRGLLNSLSRSEISGINTARNDAQPFSRHTKGLGDMPRIGVRNGDHEPRRQGARREATGRR